MRRKIFCDAMRFCYKEGLFGSFVVIRVCGRINNGSISTLTNSFKTEEEAETFVNKILRKRLKAQNRLGVNYHLLDVEKA